ncbi:MAG: glycosyltransferase family 4 protein [Candidatus Pacearchaeota archaeon]
MKILEISPFSAGICGVWTRVFGEASRLAKKHDVYIYSSDIYRGSNEKKKAKFYEEIDNLRITRFPTKGSFGQNTFFWNYKKQALKLKPDIIITHAYRQYYSTKALEIAKKLNIPCFLVTHAPFLDPKLRNWKLNLAVSIYDFFIGRRILNQYSGIIHITQWELPYLKSLGVEDEKLIYLPNGIPNEFFSTKLNKAFNNKILFLGRVAPIKNLEILIRAIYLLKDKNINLDIVGPAEENYKNELIKLIKKLGLEENIKFYPAIYKLKEKINLIDKYGLFVLPSKREGLPQSLIEAMARERIVISSSTMAGKELIKPGENGFIFEIGNENQLAEIFKKILNMSKKQKEKIQKNARISVKKFAWNKLIKNIEDILAKNN